MKKPILTIIMFCVMASGAVWAQKNVKELVAEGWKQIEAEDFDAALAACEKALFQSPDDVEAHALNGALKYTFRQYRTSMEELTFAIDHKTKNYKAYLYRSYIYLDIKEWKMAEADLLVAIKLNRDQFESHRLLGVAYFFQDRNDEAMREYNTAIAMAPEHPSAYYWRAKLYREAGVLGMSNQDLRKAIELKYTDVALAYDQLAKNLLDEARFKEAEASVVAGLAEDSARKDLWNTRGMVEHNQEHYQEAMLYYQRAAAIDSTDPAAFANMGKVMMDMDSMVQAIGYLDIAVELTNSNWAWYLVRRGDCKAGLGQYESAILDYNKAIVADVDFIQAFLGRAKARVALKLCDKAQEDYARCLKLAPNDAYVRFHKARAYWLCSDYDKAKPAIESYCGDYPDDPTGWYIRAQIESHFENHEQAIKYFGVCLEKEAVDSAEVYYWRASNYHQLKNDVAAGKDLDSCIALNPQNSKLQSTMGYMLNELGRYEEALKILNASIAQDTTHAYAYNNRGFARYKLGDYAGSIPDFNRSIALKNDYFHWPPHFRGNALRAMGKLDEAIADFNLSLSYVPDYAPALNDRGETYEKMGKLDLALKDYEAAVAADPEHAAAQANLARLKK